MDWSADTVKRLKSSTGPSNDNESAIGPLFIHWKKPNIIYPPNDSIVPYRFVFTARAATVGVPIHAWKVQMEYTNSAGKKVTVQLNHTFELGWFGAWMSEMKCVVEFPPGITTLNWVRAEYHAGISSRWGYAERLKKRVLLAPVITQPSTSWTAFPRFSGTGEEGATVSLISNVINDFGKAVVKNKQWAFTSTVAWPMTEVITLKAFQNLDFQGSGPSEPVSFSLLFPPQILYVSVPLSGMPTVSGNGGLAGLTTEVFLADFTGGVQLATTVLENGSWSVSAQRAWPAGHYTIKARQRSTLTSAVSDWSLERSFSVGPSRPGLHNPGFVKVARPLLSGTGANGATIKVYQNADYGRVIASAVVANGQWSTTPTQDLTSGDPTTLVAEQWLNNTSTRSELVPFTLLLPPELTDANFGEDGIATVGGKGLAGCTVRVTASQGSVPPLDATVQSNGHWYAIAARRWVPGLHMLTAVHIGKNFYAHRSDVSGLLEVDVKPDAPLIAQPPIPTLPTQALVITNVIPGNSTLQMYDADTKKTIAGSFSGFTANRTFTPAQHWALGTRSVYAIQTFNGAQSAPSSICRFFATLEKLTVLYPEHQEVMEQGGAFSGRDGYGGPGSTVVLYTTQSSSPVATAIPHTDGVWSSTALPLLPGEHVLNVAIKLGALLSPPFLRSFSIKPRKLSITAPAASPILPKQALMIVGDHIPGAILKMHNDAGQVDGTFSKSGTSYTFTPLKAWLPGAQQVWVTQMYSGIQSDPSSPVSFSARPVQPLIGQPQEQSLAASDAPVIGSCSRGAAVFLLGRDGNILTEAEVTGSRWQANYGWSAPGVQSVRAIQVLNHVDSQPADIRTFYIKPRMAVISPPEKPILARHPLKITGVYPSSVIRLVDDGGKNIAGGFAGSGVERLFTPAGDWLTGNNTVRAIQTVNSIASDPSLPCVFSRLPMPLKIIPPADIAEPAQALTVVNVDPSASKLIMYLDGHVQVPGHFSGSAGTFTFTPIDYWAPGVSTSVYATQIVNDAESLPSEPCRFTAKPFAPAFEVPRPGGYYDAEFEMGGICAEGAAVQVLNLDGTVLSTWQASGNRWAGIHSWAMPGPKHKRLKQIVNGVESDPGPLCDFTIMVNAPSVTLPGSVFNAFDPIEITGVHPSADKVRVFNPRTQVRGTVEGTGSVRYFTPDTAWAHDSEICAAQVVEEFQSDPGKIVRFKVHPPMPKIVLPVHGAQYNATVELSGEGTSGSTVFVFDLDNNQLASFPVSGRSWKGQCSSFKAGIQHIKVRQSYNGMASPFSAFREFAVKPQALIIVPAESPAKPLQALTVQGVEAGSTSLRLISNGTPVAGVFVGDGSVRRFIPDQMWWAQNKVYAIQTVDGIDSDWSDPYEFSAAIEAPIIDHPVPNQLMALHEPIYGHVQPSLEGARMILHDATSGQFVAFVNVDVDGHWVSKGSLRLDPGFHEIFVTLALGDLPTVESTRCSFRLMPYAPEIVPPTEPVQSRQALTIVYLHAQDASIAVIDAHGHDVAGSIVNSGLQATFTPDQSWPSGENRIRAYQVIGGVRSLPSVERIFNVPSALEIPSIVFPHEGTQNPSRPRIKIAGLPAALISLRNAKDNQLLHVQSADENGFLDLVLTSRLPPGPTQLQVKQRIQDRESPWGQPYGFFVSPKPQTPIIERPTQNSGVQPDRVEISGRGTRGGELLLRHEGDEVDLLATLTNTSSTWRWLSTTRWAEGEHGVRVQLVQSGDASDWSEVRKFRVKKGKFSIGEVGPVLSQPVVGENQSVLLRMQVVDTETGEGQQGVTVRWITDETADRKGLWVVSQTTHGGWAEYRYTPDAEGEHPVEAEVSDTHSDLILHVGFTVKALQENPWSEHFVMYLDDVPVNLALSELKFRRGMTHSLRLEVRDSSMIGSTVALEDLADAEASGLECSPAWGERRTVDGQPMSWSVTSSSGDETHCGVKCVSSDLPDWHVPCLLLSDDLRSLIEVKLDKFSGKALGQTLYLCRGAVHTLVLEPRSDEVMDKQVSLVYAGDPVDHGVILSPLEGVPRAMKKSGLSWTFDCTKSAADVLLALEMKIGGWEIASRVLPISLAHHKAVFSETFGPQAVPGTPPYLRYGVRVASAYSEQILANHPVILIKDRQVYHQVTDENGWAYVNYFENETVTFNLPNLYDQQ